MPDSVMNIPDGMIQLSAGGAAHRMRQKDGFSGYGWREAAGGGAAHYEVFGLRREALRSRKSCN